MLFLFIISSILAAKRLPPALTTSNFDPLEAFTFSQHNQNNSGGVVFSPFAGDSLEKDKYL